jgi:hypothetical protein
VSQVDCIYVAASAHDARYTRTCVASIRYFYPDIPIRLLVGGRLQCGLANELRRYWGTGIADLPAGDYGWGFVKLEPLFGPARERFLVLDSDTVLAGLVLEARNESSAPFLVDDEWQSEADTKGLYYDWEKVRKIDPDAHPPQFVFNTGQWFGTAGVLTRDDFAPWIEWTMPRKACPPGHFMNGEQGLLNYVLNRKAALDGLAVDRRKIMRWPGHSMDGLNVETVSKRTAPPVVIHWAGMKKPRQRDLIGADLLGFFERLYYRRLLGGEARRAFGSCWATLSDWHRGSRLRMKLAYRRRTPK